VLPEQQRPFLASPQLPKRAGAGSSVPAVSIFGYGLKTTLHVKIDRPPTGSSRARVPRRHGGDLSVPSGSAVLKGSEIHPVAQEHGALYADDDVR